MSILNHFFDYKPEVLALDEKAMELWEEFDILRLLFNAHSQNHRLSRWLE